MECEMTNRKIMGFVIFMVLFSGCGPKGFIKGDYEDVEKENLLDDRWSESDMQKVVNDLVAQMLKSLPFKEPLVHPW